MNALHERPHYGLESRPKFEKCFRINLPRWANTCIEFKIEKRVFDEYISIPSPNIEFKSSFAQNAIFNSLNGVSPLTATTIELFVNGKQLVIKGIDIEKSSPYLIQKRLRFNNQIVVKKTNTDEITPGSLIVHSQPIYRDGVCVGRGFPAQIITGKGNLRSAVIVNGFPTESPVVDFAGVVEGRPCEASRNRYLPSIKENEWKEWFVRCKNTVDLGKINSYAWARWAIRLNEYPGNVPIFYDFKGTKIRLSDLDILRDCESIYVVDRFRSDSQFLEAHYVRYICTKELNIKIRGMHLTLVTTICRLLSWKIILGQFLNLKNVSTLRKLAVNILPTCVGRMVSVVLDVIMIKPGIWNEKFTGVTGVTTRFPLLRELFFKAAGNH